MQNLIPNQSLFLTKWKMGQNLKLRHGFTRSPSLNSHLLWTSLVLLPPALRPWHSSTNLWAVVQEHPCPSAFGKQKIRAGHSVPCQGSGQGLGDLLSPHSAVLLLRNEQQYFTGHAGSCCGLGEMEETAYASSFEDGWVGRVISRLCKWKNRSCSIQLPWKAETRPLWILRELGQTPRKSNYKYYKTVSHGFSPFNWYFFLD